MLISRQLAILKQKMQKIDLLSNKMNRQRILRRISRLMKILMMKRIMETVNKNNSQQAQELNKNSKSNNLINFLPQAKGQQHQLNQLLLKEQIIIILRNLSFILFQVTMMHSICGNHFFSLIFYDFLTIYFLEKGSYQGTYVIPQMFKSRKGLNS